MYDSKDIPLPPNIECEIDLAFTKDKFRLFTEKANERGKYRILIRSIHLQIPVSTLSPDSYTNMTNKWKNNEMNIPFMRTEVRAFTILKNSDSWQLSDLASEKQLPFRICKSTQHLGLFSFIRFTKLLGVAFLDVEAFNGNEEDAIYQLKR